MKYLIEKYLCKFLFILSLFLMQNARAQLLIPFRSGKLWGVCDTLGNIKLKPAYDAVLFGNENRNLNKAAFPKGYFLVKKNGKYGVLQNREILPPVYDHIYCIDQSYFIAETKTATTEQDEILTLEGNPPMPAGYQLQKAVWKYYGDDNGMQQPIYIVFSFRDSTNREGLFCYNLSAPKRSGILIRDYATLRQVSMRNQQLTIRAKKTFSSEDEFILIGYHSQQKNIIVLERNSTGDFNAEKYKKSVDDNGYDIAIAPEPEMDEHPRPAMVLEVVERGAFRIESNTVYLDIQTNYNSKRTEDSRKKYTQSYELPAGAEQISIVNYKSFGTFRHQLKYGDTTRELTNYVCYRQNGKTGFIVSGKIVAAQYDSVMGFSINVQPNQSTICLMAGIRDKAGVLNWGVVDAKGNTIIPIRYSSMQYRNDFFASTMKYGGGKWLVKQEKYYGLLTADNQVLLKNEYDTIQHISRSSSSPVFTLLKKGNVYGVYYLENEGLYTSNLPPVLIVPFSKYPIAELLFLPRTKSPARNYFTLLLLANEKGEAIGYAGKSGIYYFKD